MARKSGSSSRCAEANAEMRYDRAMRVLCLSLICCATALAQDAGELDRAADWIQDDIEAGYAKAKATGKPLLVAFR